MNPSFDKGLARSPRSASSLVLSTSRMRKECVCDPWSNWAESGKDENALHRPIKLGNGKPRTPHIHVLSFNVRQGQRGKDGHNGGTKFQIKIHYNKIHDLVFEFQCKPTKCNGQNPPPKTNELFGLEIEIFNHDLFGLYRRGCDHGPRDGLGASKSSRWEYISIQQVWRRWRLQPRRLRVAPAYG